MARNKSTPKGLPLSPETVTAVVDSLGKGMSYPEAAALHKVSEKSVQRIATNEQHRETIAQARLNLRATTAAKLETLAPEVLVRIEQAVRDESLKPVDRAKVVDGLSRAVGALEKVGASVSGELSPRRDMPSVGVVVQIAPWATSKPQVEHLGIAPPPDMEEPVTVKVIEP